MRDLVVLILLGGVALLAGCTAPGSSSRAFDVAPKYLFRAEPVYPPELMKAGITGSALVEFTITARGDVVNPYAVRATHPQFALAAVEALRLCKFEPATKAGTPVSTRMQVPLTFDLQDRRHRSAVSRPAPMLRNSANPNARPGAGPEVP